MFKLFVNETTISSGTLKISWCLSENTIKDLYDIRNIFFLEELYVVVCVTNEKNMEYRNFFPLKDLIAYLPLRFSGQNKISAFITCKSFANRCIHKSYFGYDFNVFDYNGHIYENSVYRVAQSINSAYTYTTEPIIIDVPKECFAKEPSEFEKKWVNWILSSKSIDQCSFRRKRLFAYTIQPIIFLFKELLLSILLLISLFFGLRSSKEVFNLLVNPLSLSFCGNFDLFDLIHEGSIFVSDKDKNISYLRLFFAPFILPPIILGLFIFFKYYSIFTLLKILVIFMAITSLHMIGFVIVGRFISIKYDSRKLNQELLDSQTLKSIICDGSDKPTNLSELPKEKRTIKLRFLDLKSKVCKPFSL